MLSTCSETHLFQCIGTYSSILTYFQTETYIKLQSLHEAKTIKNPNNKSQFSLYAKNIKLKIIKPKPRNMYSEISKTY